MLMKKSAIVSLVFIVFFTFSISVIAQEMNPEAGKLYNEGNKLLKEGNYKAAVENYDKALKIDSDHRIYYQKSIALKNAGNLEESKNALEECLKKKPDFEAAYNALGGVYFSMGNFDKAVTNFEKVLEISKNNNIKNRVKKNLALAYARMGNSALTDGNHNRAIEYFTKSVQTNNYDAAYLSLAKLYSELGEWDKSIAASENALKYRTSISKGGPHYYMGISYKGKGDLAKAKQFFTEAKTDATYKRTAEYELSLLN